MEFWLEWVVWLKGLRMTFCRAETWDMCCEMLGRFDAREWVWQRLGA